MFHFGNCMISDMHQTSNKRTNKQPKSLKFPNLFESLSTWTLKCCRYLHTFRICIQCNSIDEDIFISFPNFNANIFVARISIIQLMAYGIRCTMCDKREQLYLCQHSIYNNIESHQKHAQAPAAHILPIRIVHTANGIWNISSIPKTFKLLSLTRQVFEMGCKIQDARCMFKIKINILWMKTLQFGCRIFFFSRFHFSLLISYAWLRNLSDDIHFNKHLFFIYFLNFSECKTFFAFTSNLTVNLVLKGVHVVHHAHRCMRCMHCMCVMCF